MDSPSTMPAETKGILCKISFNHALLVPRGPLFGFTTSCRVPCNKVYKDKAFSQEVQLLATGCCLPCNKGQVKTNADGLVSRF
eukprot:1144332-Pelagomonas_calceolata.AAC.1